MSSDVATTDRRVVVNADDFGFTDGITRGIIEAHLAGTVHRTSMMVGQPGWAYARRALHDDAQHLAVGLHLNLLVGTPCTPAASLTGRDGRFLSMGQLASRAFTGSIVEAEVVAETTAQLARLRDAGIAVTHIDSHRHVHALPTIRQGVATAAAQAGIAEVRVPIEARPTLLGMTGPRIKAHLLAVAWQTRNALSRPRPLRAFAGLALFDAGELFAERFIALLGALPAGPVEIMVHPGYVDAALAPLDTYLKPRETELRALCSVRVREALLAPA